MNMSTENSKNVRRQMADKCNHMQYFLQNESISNIYKAPLLTHTHTHTIKQKSVQSTSACSSWTMTCRHLRNV